MADRTKDRRLHRVAEPEPLRLERLLLEPPAVECDRDKRGERGEEARLDLVVPRRVRRDEEQPDPPLPDLERDDRLTLARLPPRRAHPRARHLEHPRGRRRELVELRGHVLTLEQRERDFGKQRLLALPLLRLGGAPACLRRQVADDERRDAVHGEREPVRPSASSKVWRGARKKKLKASMLATATRDRVAAAPERATGRTAKR